jgi:hypothetical protein
MLDKLSPEARHLMLLSHRRRYRVGQHRAADAPRPARGIPARRTHHCGARVAHPDHATVRDRRPRNT